MVDTTARKITHSLTHLLLPPHTHTPTHARLHVHNFNSYTTHRWEGSKRVGGTIARVLGSQAKKSNINPRDYAARLLQCISTIVDVQEESQQATVSEKKAVR